MHFNFSCPLDGSAEHEAASGFKSAISAIRVIGFDHRKSVLSKISPSEDSDPNLGFQVNIEKSSSTSVYEYFSAKLSETISNQVT